MTRKTIPAYSREELYTYAEAAKVIGVAKSSISRAVSWWMLTSTRLPHEIDKFVLRSEVDALAGLGSVASPEAKARIDAVRNKNSGSLDDRSTGEIAAIVSKVDDVNSEVTSLHNLVSTLTKQLEALSAHFGLRQEVH